ncbi:hypothetical protein T484DRAFT_1784073 [Baffinella frigidus]|nr:hypothetical protein T484DRAFT_1784073 [Cryptophyta sp. CCMP2293]
MPFLQNHFQWSSRRCITGAVELAPMHHRRGVAPEHLPVMGPLLVKVFAGLGGADFTLEMQTAWAW